MVAHNALGNSELHEPKGVASATDYYVYVADGAGSGAWEPLIEEATAVSLSGTSTTVTGLGDYAVVYIMIPEIASSSTTDHFFTLRVGNAGGLTTSGVYYTSLYNKDGQLSNFGGTAWSVAWSQTDGARHPTYGESYALITIMNFNKPYYSTMSSVANIDKAQLTNLESYHCFGMIREQKAYDRITIYDSYTWDDGDILVTGIKG